MTDPSSKLGLEPIRSLSRQLAQAAAEAEPSAPVRRPSLRALAIAAACAVVAVLTLTPGGRSIATAAFELIGIGDEPTAPPISGEESIVIGSGETAREYRYEVVAETAGDATCVRVDFPAAPQPPTRAQCITDVTRREDPSRLLGATVQAAPPEFMPDAQLLVEGLAPTEVAEVAVSDGASDPRKSPYRATTSVLDAELAQELGVADRAAFFFVPLPPGVLEGTGPGGKTLTQDSIAKSIWGLQLTGYDADGREVASGPLNPQFSKDWLVGDPPPGFVSDSEWEGRVESDDDVSGASVTAADCPSEVSILESSGLGRGSYVFGGRNCPSGAEIERTIETFQENQLFAARAARYLDRDLRP
ncbi:hypothetical protein HJD18_03460 [Thermoleophilia bacterium SCSIO 60948]|nr:hypothetical protein HJD18_03460 [Thermoleophilia bacterium SCSIO 60948]